MNWFRWWHGTTTDPKFQWVTRRSAQPLPTVIAVWACLLECASNATQCNGDATRGDVASFDCNDHDVLLGLEDGRVQKVWDAMVEKKLIVDGRIAGWENRQPKREDSGNPNTGALSSTQRSRLSRERKKHIATDGDTMQRDATLRNDREEKIREEEIKEEPKTLTNTDVLVVASAADDQPAAVLSAPPKDVLPDCPHQKIIDLYARHLPLLPFPRVWEGERQKIMRVRWRWVLTAAKRDGSRYATDEQAALDYFDRFFGYVAKNDFLSGRNGKWRGCNLVWLMTAKNFAKVIDGHYEEAA